ncbi:MAG: acetyltransferase [Clostridia bacterium]|nr:acetyltransferase [Clostridia bacterium]
MNIKRKFYTILYYSIARHFPYQPLPGYKFGNAFRSFCCKRIFKKCGKNVTIKSKAYFGDGINIEIDDYSQLGINCKVDNDLIMGKYVLMGPDVVIFSTSHEYKDINIPMMNQGGKERKKVIVGDDVWIGTRVIILPGVKIGNHVIIGAGSIVTHDIPDYSVAVGSPARVVRDRRK